MHHAAVMEILVLVHFLHHDHFAVRRCHHHVFRVTLETPYRTTEEIDHDKIDNRTDDSGNIKGKLAFKRIIQDGIEQHQSHRTRHKRMRPFSVYSDFFQFV